MRCPCCKKIVKPSHFSCVRAARIGKIMTEKKREALRRNAQSRWAAYYKSHPESIKPDKK